MHTYFGKNGGAIVPIDIPGMGVWAFPQVPDDGNDRDAATVAIGIEGVQDNVVWLFHRMVDGQIGGTYPGDMEWTGTHIFHDPVTIDDTATIKTLIVQLTSTLTGNVSCGANLTVGGNTALVGTFAVLGPSTFNGFVTFNKEVTFNDPVIVNDDAFERVGDGAYEAIRSSDGPDATTTIQPWTKDVWTATLTADREWTLANPPTGKNIRVMFIASPSHELVLKNASGAPMYNLLMGSGASKYRMVELIWQSNKWLLGAASLS